MNFDTHQYIKNFKDAGINEEQAEVIIAAIQKTQDFDFSKMATKEDIADIKTLIAKQDASQKVWFIALFITMIGIMTAIFTI